MTFFDLISEPESYNADTWDIGLCPDAKAYWLCAAVDSLEHTLDQYRNVPVVDILTLEASLTEAKKDFASEIDALKLKGNDQWSTNF